jgi:hypothetical protein
VCLCVCLSVCLSVRVRGINTCALDGLFQFDTAVFHSVLLNHNKFYLTKVGIYVLYGYRKAVIKFW